MSITSIDPAYFNMGLPGQCYMAACGVAAVLEDTGLNPVICHGVGTCCPEGDIPGQRMMHAWVEIEIPALLEKTGRKPRAIHLKRAVDASRVNKPIACLATADYYRIGRVNPKLVRRYLPQYAWRLLATLDHFGPWHAPLEPSDDWTAEDQAKIDSDGLYRCSDHEASISDLQEHLPWLNNWFLSMYQMGTK